MTDRTSDFARNIFGEHHEVANDWVEKGGTAVISRRVQPTRAACPEDGGLESLGRLAKTGQLWFLQTSSRMCAGGNSFTFAVTLKDVTNTWHGWRDRTPALGGSRGSH